MWEPDAVDSHMFAMILSFGLESHKSDETRVLIG